MALESLRIALSGLAGNRLRSALTILGLTIGVASVIVLIAVGNGSSRAVEQRIQALGTNVLLVLGRAGATGPRARAATSAAPLTTADATALQDPVLAPDVRSASPVVQAPNVTLTTVGESYSPSQFVGTTPAYLTAHNYAIAAGSGLSAADVTRHADVAVIGPTVAASLFAGQNPIGQTVRAGGVGLLVIGETAPKGSNGAQDQDDVVFAPISTVQDSLTGFGSLSSITVQASSEGALASAQAEVSSILEKRHGTTAANPGFAVINQGSILRASSATSSVFTTLLGEVAAISLLVGGIGVMNIMLVSVTERTREIGIRKAVGARRGDILSQFLIEAVVLSLIGGLVGVLLGVLGSRLTIAGVHPVIAGYSVPLAFFAAVASGLLFGTLPATRAAALRPIEALRFE